MDISSTLREALSDPSVRTGLTAALGMLVGSFVNLVAERVPQGRSVVNEPSTCPGCGTRLRARDLVPVLSWLWLRGRCRTCRAPIGWRHPAVEVVTAAVYAALASSVGWNADLIAYLIAFSGLLTLALIDIDHHRIPVVVLYPTLAATTAVLVAIATIGGRESDLLRAAIGAAGAFAVILVIHLVRPDGMGFGDVRLAALCGLVLGWSGLADVVLGLYSGFLLGAVVGGVLLLTRRVKRGTPVPFGPFLASGAFVVVCFGHSAADGIRSQF